jgi:hypothetical protein
VWTRLIAALQTAEAAINGPKEPCDSIVPDAQVREIQRLLQLLIGFWNFICTESLPISSGDSSEPPIPGEGDSDEPPPANPPTQQ